MILFKSNRPLRKIEGNALIYSTPFGNVYFDVIFNKTMLSNIKPNSVQNVNQILISSWYLKECRVEFLRTNFSPDIPPGMKVEDCLAGIWRVQSLCEQFTPSFQIHLDTKSERYPNTGERLMCLSFENNSMILSIGTEDEESLAWRANKQKWMPSHFEDITSDAIHLISDGIQTTLSHLKLQECVQLQFIIAWSLKKYPETSSWYAVDQSTDAILRAIDIA